VRATT